MSAISRRPWVYRKDTIVKVEGGYHGAHERGACKARIGRHLGCELVRVPAAAVKHTVQVPFNELKPFQAL